MPGLRRLRCVKPSPTRPLSAAVCFLVDGDRTDLPVFPLRTNRVYGCLKGREARRPCLRGSRPFRDLNGHQVPFIGRG
jgi:hypothetical protein